MVRIAFALIIASQIAVWVAVRAVERAPANLVVVAPPDVPPLAPASTPTPTSTPRPTPTPTPRHWHAHAEKLDATIDHLHASRSDGDLLAAWNKHDLYVSRDGGKTFAQVLAGPGELADVGFDSAGNVLAIRDAAVGVLDADGERWRTIPGIAAANDEQGKVTVAPKLIDGGPDIVVAGAAPGDRYYGWLAASSDGGASWRYHTLDGVYEADRARGAQALDGTIRIALPVADCDYEGTVWITWSRSGFMRNQIDGVRAGFEVYGDRAVGGGAVARANDSEWRKIYDAPDDAIAIEAPAPMLVAGAAIYRVAYSTAEKLPYCVDGSDPIVDAANRIWMISDGEPRLAKLGSCPPINGE